VNVGRIKETVPGFLKPILRPLYRIYQIATHRPKNPEELRQYWKNPWDGSNLPASYLKGEARSRFLSQLLKKYTPAEASVLELGCNVGRNLQVLYMEGFRNLNGVEISEGAVKLLKESFPEMADHATIHTASIEETLGNMQNNEFDVVFTMAVLAHIHDQNRWIFPEIARISKSLLITIEDERKVSWRHFPRNYKKIFERYGMKEIESMNCIDIEGLRSDFMARVFKKTAPA
jgi:SAM-dependent methyltransferase